MGVEIERKFLVASEAWRTPGLKGVRYRQGYLASEGGCTVRVRVSVARAVLGVKGRQQGLTRLEYEYDIPAGDAEAMLDALCRHPPIDKTRYRVPHAGRTWEVDVFHGENEGLVLAELELSREDEAFEKPGWLGLEVSRDPRYRNARLAERPYRSWPEKA